jgi:hypothetical protein
MIFSGIIPNVLNISLIEKKGKIFIIKYIILTSKRRFNLFWLQKCTMKKICLQYAKFSLF